MSAAALRDAGADPGACERAAMLLDPVVAAANRTGRPMFAANAALQLPGDPIGAVWQPATTLREQRGDGHVAALTGKPQGAWARDSVRRSPDNSWAPGWRLVDGRASPDPAWKNFGDPYAGNGPSTLVEVARRAHSRVTGVRRSQTEGGIGMSDNGNPPTYIDPDPRGRQ